jgi:hypothetical protein
MIYKPLTGILSLANYGLRALGAPKVADDMISPKAIAPNLSKGLIKLRTRQEEMRVASLKLVESSKALSEKSSVFNYGKKAIETKTAQWLGKKASWAHNLWFARASRWPFKTALYLSYRHPKTFYATGALLTASAATLLLMGVKEAGDYFWLSQPTCEPTGEMVPMAMLPMSNDSDHKSSVPTEYAYELSDVNDDGIYDMLAVREGPKSLGTLRPVVSLSLREGVLEDGLAQNLEATISVLYPSYAEEPLEDFVITATLFDEAVVTYNKGGES